MRRILLIGPGGAGKSELSRHLAARLGLPLFHLDALYWRPGWEKTPEPEWRSTVETLARGDAWIMDGNFGGTLDLRLAACDTAILMDLAPWRCLWRVCKRRLRHRGIARADMHPGCPERIDLDFLIWIATYRWRRRAKILAKFADAARGGVLTIVLDTPRAVDAFVASLPQAHTQSATDTPQD